jgi:hypothetical protein
MTTGIAGSVAQDILDAYCSSIAWSEPAAFYVKLHTGDPGVDGTTAAATNATRTQATFAAATTAGTITTNADITWTSVSTTETYSHVSFWDASTAGTFIGSDDLSSPVGVTAGDDFTIASGDLDISLGTVAA